MPVSSEKFILGHNLVSNNFPKVIPLEKFGVKPYKIDVENFGLFDIATPSFSTYYPEVTPEDLVPQPEDFVYPIFRALSEVTVNKYGPIDFSMDGVLKKSAKKLIGQTVYPNHESHVGNEIGVVIEAFWQEETLQDKVKIPAGINSRFKLDGKSNPKTVRGVMMEPPSIHSTSVGVTFAWEKSHPNLSDEEFWNKLGSYDDKGNLIRRVVTDIISYNEISLVAHGADPYAQKINETGGIMNPKYAKSKDNQFSAEDFTKMAHHQDWKDLSSLVLNHTEPATIPITLKDNPYTWNLNTDKMNPQLLALLMTSFALGKDTTPEQASALLEQKLPGLLKDSADLAALKTKYPDGTKILTPDLEAKLATVDNLTAENTAILTAARAEVLKNYQLSGGKDEAITQLINGANLTTLNALGKQYATQVEASFTATCQDCQSTNVKRQSSLTSGAEGDTPPAIKSTATAAQELGEKIRKNQSKGFFGTQAPAK